MASYTWVGAPGGDFETVSNRDPDNGILVTGDDVTFESPAMIARGATASILAPGTDPADFMMVQGSDGRNYFVYDGPPPCFYPGTRLATPSGQRSVDALEVGDLVLTADGRSMPVKWIGKAYVSRRFSESLRVLPIRIRAGALAENMPARDLLVSPDQALLVCGVLVQAGALVNGSTFIRDDEVPERFTYYHVELESHELLLAEGAQVESFVDSIDRMSAHNGEMREARYDAVPEMDYPRAKSARQVPRAVRREIAARKAAFGMPQAA